MELAGIGGGTQLPAGKNDVLDELAGIDGGTHQAAGKSDVLDDVAGIGGGTHECGIKSSAELGSIEGKLKCSRSRREAIF